MTPDGPVAISINDAAASLTYLPDRRPTTTPDESKDAFALLSDYRDGGIFVGHWAGKSEWERHTVGDEIVMVLDGETTIYFLTNEGEPGATLRAGEFVIVHAGHVAPLRDARGREGPERHPTTNGPQPGATRLSGGGGRRRGAGVVAAERRRMHHSRRASPIGRHHEGVGGSRSLHEPTRS